MKRKTILKTASESTLKTSEVSAQPINRTEPIKIQGILTSNLRNRKSTDIPFMAFLWLEYEKGQDSYSAKHCQAECERIKCQECEIPVIFRWKRTFKDPETQEILYNNFYSEPELKKGDRVILEGIWAKSEKSKRPSFTCFSYQLIKD